MGMWFPRESDPRFTYGKLRDQIRGMIYSDGPAQKFRWYVSDYRDGLERRVVVGSGEADSIQLAVEAAELAATNYSRNPGRRLLTGTPLTSTERNRLRMERLTAKEAAADLGGKLLLNLYEDLRVANCPEWARRVETILRTTALKAFAVYSNRFAKIIDQRKPATRGDKEYKYNGRPMAILVEEVNQLSESTANGSDVYKKFDRLLNEMKPHGFVAEESLVTAVQQACYLAIVPGPQRLSADELAKLGPPPSISADMLFENTKIFGQMIAQEQEYEYDLVDLLVASAPTAPANQS